VACRVPLNLDDCRSLSLIIRRHLCINTFALCFEEETTRLKLLLGLSVFYTSSTSERKRV
jgi:hypothetical protein